ncbi:MAG: AraC family transcriptional regulator ligand-binding domain-containing protein [Xanthobacteraceae bacterium]
MRYRTPPAKRLSTIPSCAGVMTRAACARARAAGVDLPPLLRRIGLTARDIENESVPLRVTSQIKCLNLVAEALGDRLLGFHVAQGMDLRRGGLLYYVAASSEVLGDALHRIARYSSMVNEGVKLEAETGEKLRIVFAYAGVPRRHDRHQIEAWTTLIIRYCRELTGRGLQALAVRLMHHRIPESGEIDSFCGRRIEFSSDMDEVSFAGEAAKLPIANADPFLNKLLIGYSENVVTRRSARSGVIRADVENALASLLPHGQTQIKNVARRLGVGPRTLRRKLAAQGLTYAGILEELRFALARHYLSERDLPISRIAWLLGYTEVSTFSHAFRRWTGRTPRADRSRQRPAAPPSHH